jgi:hypothetical protein
VVESSGSGQEPVANSCEHGNELSGSIKGAYFLLAGRTIRFSRRILLHGVPI